jgi:hypothetical protein
MNLNTPSKLDAAKQKLRQGLGPTSIDALPDDSPPFSGGLTSDSSVATCELGHTITPFQTHAAIDSVAWSDAIQRAHADSRVASWSPPGKIVLEYLAGTTVRFSKSDVIRMALEHWIQTHYPLLWETALAEEQEKTVRSTTKTEL